MKVQLDDRWGRPSGLWSENGELCLEPVDKAAQQQLIEENIKRMNAGPQPRTLARRKAASDLRLGRKR